MATEVTRTMNYSYSERLRPEERLARLGLRQHRQVTTEQLRNVGWQADDVSYRVRSGQLHPSLPGVFSLGGPPRNDREWWMAAVMTFGRGTELSDAAAVELYGWLRYPLNDIHVTTTTKRRSRDNITTHHRDRPSAGLRIDHIPVTTPEQTILDCASTLRSDKLFRRIIRQAQAEKATSHARLLLLAAESAGVRGVARLRAELEGGPAPTRSANEDEVLDLLREPGLILTNHELDGDEVDVFLPKHGVVLEVDSPIHDNPAARKHDAAKQERLESKGLRVLRMR